MKRILIICPAFPPVNDTACRRAAAVAKYLSGLSWEVTVISKTSINNPRQMLQPEEKSNLECIDKNRIVSVDLEPATFPKNRAVKLAIMVRDLWVLRRSYARSWYKAALQKLPSELLDVDIIWATYPGAGMLLLASRISRLLGVPWVADFRDLPSQIVTAPAWVRWIAMMRLKRICASADHLTTVSEPMGKVLKDKYSARVTVIPNGYDPALQFYLQPIPRNDVFRIIYTGVIYRTQDPNPLIRAVNALIKEGKIRRNKIRLEFFGVSEACINKKNLAYLGKLLHLKPFVSLEKVMRVQREATVLLVLAMDGAEGVLTTKLFEYMAAGRPVISYPADLTGIDSVLKTTGIGRSCASEDELKAVILDWYHQWETTGDIHMERNQTEIQKWSRLEQTRQLSSLCENIISRHRGAFCS